ncbi:MULTISPECIES: periplasmic heavy metal sensor [Rhodomicrobium]|uniref:periplasmic heavy metal sensor n=1 Tax=Rhodomicrobium TaxID=1068 RepID=UPI000B4B5B45|nr:MULTISPECIES: periplasmic heavy metal sensor [Rhodomicrobium]
MIAIMSAKREIWQVLALQLLTGRASTVIRMLIICAAAFALTLGPLQAQQHGAGQHGHHQPYAGLENRPIKALSDQQLAELRAGRGMGLALAAELNGYPGPMHVLEHADALHLTPDQRAKVASLFKSMQDSAISAGTALIEAETRLNALFATGKIDPQSLGVALGQIGAAQSALRQTHLVAHLHTRDLLSQQQAAAYNRLRGYVR